MEKIQKRKMRDRVVWEGSTPSGGYAYYDGCLDCIGYKLCPCMCTFTRWRLTPTGIRERRDPPPCNICCMATINDYKDIRFLKDVDWRWEYVRLVCMRLTTHPPHDEVPEHPCHLPTLGQRSAALW
jgi:hypothetical protein